jgi:hypothetical protein
MARPEETARKTPLLLPLSRGGEALVNHEAEDQARAAMRIHHRYVSTLLVMGLGCGSGATPPAVEPEGGGSAPTGLIGTAYRGPTRPVCPVDKCDAPFSAGFEVWQGERVVARFQSDSAGRFLIHLPPGTYKVVPDESAGILVRSQVHEVSVEPSGLTQVEFNFDSGIR